MFDDDDNNMCMNKWAHTRARMKKSCKQNKERKKEYCGLYHACAKDGARARKRKRMEMKRKWNTDQNISQQNAKHIRIVLIIMWMCHKCKLHSLANVRIVPNVEQWNMWKNWCGLAWLGFGCHHLIRFLIFDARKCHANATNEKYAKHKANTNFTFPHSFCVPFISFGLFVCTVSMAAATWRLKETTQNARKHKWFRLSDLSAYEFAWNIQMRMKSTKEKLISWPPDIPRL